MQPTIIKIKFSPIIRHLQKDNTNCCLEIVPNISCIQNLDTIEWNDKNELVEYSVPVTYKIILKRDAYKTTVEKQEKVYYSCIDLRLLSTNSTMACGDITKVISDNYVLSKIADNDESRSTFSKESRNQNQNQKEACLEEQCPVKKLEELDKVCLNALAVKKGNTNEVNRKDVDFFPCPQSIDIEDKKFIKQICTECTVSKETITDASDIKNNKEKKRKLTITSVCTLNTIDNPVHDDFKENNSKIRVKYKSKTKIDYNINRITESYAMQRSFYSENNNLVIKKASPERILPELRVAHFMMSVENEILPLKILLSEIYRKCASLGLFWKSSMFPETSPACRPRYTDKINFLNCNEIKPRCNRVVYSIVFEE